MKRHELVHYLNDLLEVQKFSDYAPNGLQVEGKVEVQKVAFAVSATLDSAQKAAQWGADALIVHHGLFWKFHGPKPLIGPFAKRVRPLIKSDINLLAYHLPLDAHVEFGNAAGIALKLGLKEIEPFGDYKGAPTGLQGEFDSPIAPDLLEKKLEEILQHRIIHSAPKDQKPIKNIGIITGGANNDWELALREGLDSYLTGEISEYNWHDAAEAGVHFFAGGHHATEVFGVKSLMSHLKEKFGLECQFFNSDNPA